jgi:hypothetical protein
LPPSKRGLACLFCPRAFADLYQPDRANFARTDSGSRWGEKKKKKKKKRKK